MEQFLKLLELSVRDITNPEEELKELCEIAFSESLPTNHLKRITHQLIYAFEALCEFLVEKGVATKIELDCVIEQAVIKADKLLDKKIAEEKERFEAEFLAKAKSTPNG